MMKTPEEWVDTDRLYSDLADAFTKEDVKRALSSQADERKRKEPDVMFLYSLHFVTYLVHGWMLEGKIEQIRKNNPKYRKTQPNG